jgi:tRNA pseudouridine65 synthase
MQILYESAAVVVVDKAAGQLVHNSAWAGPPERTLTDDVRERFVEAVPVHRLDRQTSGCVLFAKTKADAAAAQASLSTTTKQYLALVRGHVAAAVDVDHPLDDDDEPGSARKEARSRIAPLASSPLERCSLVVITLFTGRRHQARRHCKHISHPIIGDATHGKGPINRDFRARYGVARMALHAWRVVVDGHVVEAPVAADLAAPWAVLFPGLLVSERASVVQKALDV